MTIEYCNIENVYSQTISTGINTITKSVDPVYSFILILNEKGQVMRAFSSTPLETLI